MSAKDQKAEDAAYERMLEAVDGHIRQNGYAAFRVTDGEMFFFTENALEKLLLRAKANEKKQVVVFVPLKRD